MPVDEEPTDNSVIYPFAWYGFGALWTSSGDDCVSSIMSQQLRL